MLKFIYARCEGCLHVYWVALSYPRLIWKCTECGECNLAPEDLWDVETL